MEKVRPKNEVNDAARFHKTATRDSYSQTFGHSSRRKKIVDLLAGTYYKEAFRKIRDSTYIPYGDPVTEGGGIRL